MGVFSTREIGIGLICALVVLAAIAGCSSDEEEAETPAREEASQRYRDWLACSHDNIVVHYPADHPHAERMPELAAGYPRAIQTDARLLQMTPPAETLHVYVYTGPGQASEITGARYPFVEGNHIHYWQPYHLGSTVMEYVLSRWTPVQPRFAFLRAGLITLMNHSNMSYHEEMARLMENDQRLPLDSLVAHTAIDHNRWMARSQQAASFVDFLIYMYGLPTFKNLWEATTGWEEAVQGLLGISSAELESEWLEFVRQVNACETPEPRPMSGRETPTDSANQ